jgi:hypothetical protein
MKILTLILLFFSFSGLSQARSWRHNNYNAHEDNHNNRHFWQTIASRQHEQHRHVDRGIKKGQLTHWETKQLTDARRHIGSVIRHYRHHPYLSHSHKREILHHLAHYSDHIYHLKHNRHYAHRHDQHTRQTYSHAGRAKLYRHNRNLSWANNNFSSGFYFRF